MCRSIPAARRSRAGCGGRCRTSPTARPRATARWPGGIGDPKAVRAVGLANGANPISIIIPCHRVIGSNGSLIGYGGGLPTKRALLSLEQGQGALL